MKVLQELLLIEERLEGVKYDEKKSKGVVNKVIATLEGNASGSFTSLAKRYKKILLLLESLDEKKKEMNPKLREKCVELFDAKDSVLTRVVKTCSLTITVAKESDEVKTKTDYEGLAQAYRELLLKDVEPNLVAALETKLDELVAQFTKVVDSKEAALRVAVDKGELSEGISDIWKAITSFAKKIVSWVKSFDRDFNKVEAKLAKIKA